MKPEDPIAPNPTQALPEPEFRPEREPEPEREDIAALAARGRVKTVARAYREEDLDGAELVLACTDDGALNAAVAEACRERRIPVNDASDRSRCDFLFPGIARRGPVVAGVTAGGRNHALARRATEAVRRCLERELDDDD